MYESFWKFGYNSYNDDDDDAFGYGETNERMKKNGEKYELLGILPRNWAQGDGKARQGMAKQENVE